MKISAVPVPYDFPDYVLFLVELTKKCGRIVVGDIRWQWFVIDD